MSVPESLSMHVSDPQLFVGRVKSKLSELGDSFEDDEVASLAEYVVTLRAAGKSVAEAAAEMDGVVTNGPVFAEWVYAQLAESANSGATAPAPASESKKRAAPADESSESTENASSEKPAKQFKVNKIVWDNTTPASATAPEKLDSKKDLRSAKFGHSLDSLSAPAQSSGKKSFGIVGAAASHPSDGVSSTGFDRGNGASPISNRLGARGNVGGADDIQSRLGNASYSNGNADNRMQTGDDGGQPGFPRQFNQGHSNGQQQQRWNGHDNNNPMSRNGMRGGYNQQSGNGRFPSQQMGMASGMQQLQSGMMGPNAPQIVQQFGMDQFGNIIPLGPVMGMPMMGQQNRRGGMQQQQFRGGMRGGYVNNRNGGMRGAYRGHAGYNGARPPVHQTQAMETGEGSAETAANDANLLPLTSDGAKPVSESGESEIVMDTVGNAASGLHASNQAATAFGGASQQQMNQQPCFYGNNCTRADCKFTHPWQQQPSSAAAARGTQQCRFWPNCLNPICAFFHPPGNAGAAASTGAAAAGVALIPCKFDAFCTKPGCPFKHTTPRTGAGGNRSMVFNKPSTSERTFASEDAEKVLPEGVEESASAGVGAGENSTANESVDAAE
ncbi:hypothetical protein BJ741DRAFT_586004 [Chytriomyces cf. hyalinus JEL632]|nr:hypothetical protein BJ741DRAFT_586004 [Chytriomyces cf. hyalinus JEL632]